MLKKSAQKIAEEPYRMPLNTRIKIPLHSGNTKGLLFIDYLTQGDVWFNPQAMKMSGIISPTDQDNFNVSLYPTLDKHTTHTELFSLRQKAEAICNTLHIPKKNKQWWNNP